MKRKNAGLSTVEIIVAAVIVVAVVVGVLIAVRMSNKGPTTDTSATEAKTIATNLINKLSDNIKSADLDIKSSDNFIRLVGSARYQVYYLDTATNKVYFTERETSELGKNEDDIRKIAEKKTFTTGEMTQIAENVKTCIVELIDKEKAEGKAKITVRAIVGDANNVENAEVPLNANLLMYFADQAGKELVLPTPTFTPTPSPSPEPATPTPTTKTEDPTKAPTDAPTEPPTPTPTPKEWVHEVTTKTSNPQGNTYDLIINQMVLYNTYKDVKLVIKVRPQSENTGFEEGMVIGGIGFDSAAIVDQYQFKLRAEDEGKEEFTFEYDWAELGALAKQLNLKKFTFRILDSTGYSLAGVDIDYWK